MYSKITVRRIEYIGRFLVGTVFLALFYCYQSDYKSGQKPLNRLDSDKTYLNNLNSYMHTALCMRVVFFLFCCGKTKEWIIFWMSLHNICVDLGFEQRCFFRQNWSYGDNKWRIVFEAFLRFHEAVKSNHWK